MTDRPPLRLLAEAFFRRGLDAADAGRLVHASVAQRDDRLHLRDRRSGPTPAVESISWAEVNRLFVTGAGKAAAWMAEALEQILGERIAAGAISVPRGPAPALRRIALRFGGHPLPTQETEAGSHAIEELWAHAGERDLILNVLTGGGSALLARPAPPLTWDDLRTAVERLLRAGADIGELNVVRKHLSSLLGGQLVSRTRARIRALVLSDVIGDRLDLIASGPTAADPSTFAEAWGVLERHQLLAAMPARVIDRLDRGRHGNTPETPKPGDADLERVRHFLIGSNLDAREAAAAAAAEAGFRVVALPDPISGEAREAGRTFAERLRQLEGAICLVAGGETTVRVVGGGRGGRNQEFALGGAAALAGAGDCLILSAGTDGIDGVTDAAGAIVDSTTLDRARRAGLDPERALRDNDAFVFFDALGDLLRTGPTRTNVMDLQIGLRRP